MMCEMMNRLPLPIREFSLLAPVDGASPMSCLASFGQGSVAVTIVVRITVLVRSG